VQLVVASGTTEGREQSLPLGDTGRGRLILGTASSGTLTALPDASSPHLGLSGDLASPVRTLLGHVTKVTGRRGEHRGRLPR
jgi:hypothetical protein